METELVTTQETSTPEIKAASKQKEAVYSFLTEAMLGTQVTVARLKTKADKAQDKKDVLKAARVRLFAGIKSGDIALKSQMNDSKLKKYCSSVINNWLKKDKRFN
jgi:hypothetical protein